MNGRYQIAMTTSNEFHVDAALPVKFSMSTPDTVAPKSSLEPSGWARGVMTGTVVLEAILNMLLLWYGVYVELSLQSYMVPRT